MYIYKLKTLQPHGFNAELNLEIPNISAFLVDLFLKVINKQKGHQKRNVTMSNT